MADLEPSSDSIDLLNDDRPLAARRKRRTTSVSQLYRDSQSGGTRTTLRNHGIQTPPTTPQRGKKRVRFSHPGIASLSTGLTPLVQRTLLSSSPSSRFRRYSTPSRGSNLSVDDSPVSFTIQFSPMRDNLSGRAKRRIRRNGLSEEMNNIESEKRIENRKWKAEKERLMKELQQKDNEIQFLRDQREIANQIGEESGIETASGQQADERVRELELEVVGLREKLQRRELEAAQDDADWEIAGQDPYNDGDSFIEDFGGDFNAEMTDVFLSTPVHRSFPSPPESLPNTPSKPASAVDVGTQAAAADPEKLHLESQLKTLKDQVEVLNRASELASTAHDRLTTKLTPFMPESGASEDSETLDAALDCVITQLALAQSSALESNTRFSALSTELSALFSGTSCSDPESIIQHLRTQFRQARLDLEYLSPGENPEGFDNTELLSMLTSRLRVLTEKAARQDSSIDEYHEQEISLRQQLSSHVDAVASLQVSLATAQSSASTMESELKDRDESISRLNNALQSYRDEVNNLESLISRVEVEHAADIAMLNNDVESARKDTQAKLGDAYLERDKLVAAAESREIQLSSLKQQLEAAQSRTKEMHAQLEAFIKENMCRTMSSVPGSALESKQEHSEALAQKESQIAQLKVGVERLNAKVESEREVVRTIATAMRRQSIAITEMSMAATEMADRYLDGNTSGNDHGTGSDINSGAGHGVMRTSSIDIPRPGLLFNSDLARRPSTGPAAKKRKRYDSGMGFLDEEEEVSGM